MAKILKRRFLLVFSKNLSLNDGKSREQHARGKKNPKNEVDANR